MKRRTGMGVLAVILAVSVLVDGVVIDRPTLRTRPAARTS